MPCTSAIQLGAPVVRFARIHTDVQRPPEHPTSQQLRDMAKGHPGVRPTRLGRGHCLGLTEGLRNVNVVLTLPQLQQIVSYAVPCRFVEKQRPPETVGQTPIQQFDSTKGRSLCSQLAPEQKSIQQTLDPRVITRQLHIGTHWCTTWQIAWFRQLQLL